MPHHHYFDFALKYAIRKVKENQEELELTVTQQIFICADDDNIVGKNIHTIKKNRETLLNAIKEVGLEANPQKTKYMFTTCYQNAVQNHNKCT
jgi:histidinol-phosphate/aromatic aminotransferase/cobyric acid decarboxylase-like protein